MCCAFFPPLRLWLFGRNGDELCRRRLRSGGGDLERSSSKYGVREPGIAEGLVPIAEVSRGGEPRAERGEWLGECNRVGGRRESMPR